MGGLGARVFFRQAGLENIRCYTIGAYCHRRFVIFWRDRLVRISRYLSRVSLCRSMKGSGKQAHHCVPVGNAGAWTPESSEEASSKANERLGWNELGAES